MDRERLFPSLPKSLASALFAEFDEVQAGYYEGKWRSSGLNAGRFCEVCYTVIVNSSTGKFPAHASKPKDFIGSCKRLESDSKLSHGLRMIGSRVLTVLYEIRNNRDVSHTTSVVSPSFMDASLALANCKWLLAELVREFHGLSESEAQSVVDNLSQYASPLVWADANVRRVLAIGLNFDERLLLLLASAGGEATADELVTWIDSGSKKYLSSRIKKLHDDRQIESKAYGEKIRILPNGNRRVEGIARNAQKTDR